MYQIAVIADDFTSVTDCTTPFACRGWSTAALAAVPGGALPRAQALGLNTDSRPLPAEEAYGRNLEAARRLREAGCQWVYKSVDSTLRGNLGAEIDGVMDGLGFSIALVAPAFPHYGRTTLGGFHHLHGTLLENSPIARDPVCPAKTSSVRTILESQSVRKVACLGLETVRGSSQNFAGAAGLLQADGYSLLVLDAETEEDLEQIARHTAALKSCLVVGSTGLARHMAQVLPAGPGGRKVSSAGTAKPVIVAAASVSPVTGEQVERLLEEGAAERCLLSPAQAAFGGLEAPAAQAEAILRRGSDLILQVDASPQARESSAAAARKAGVSQGEMGARIAAALSRLAGDLLSQGLSKGVVLTGGDMAQAVLEYFGSGGMELWGEVEPGIPAGRLLGGGCLAVTKAGAFGTPQALCAARRWLKGKP